MLLPTSIRELMSLLLFRPPFAISDLLALSTVTAASTSLLLVILFNCCGGRRKKKSLKRSSEDRLLMPGAGAGKTTMDTPVVDKSQKSNKPHSSKAEDEPKTSKAKTPTKEQAKPKNVQPKDHKPGKPGGGDEWNKIKDPSREPMKAKGAVSKRKTNEKLKKMGAEAEDRQRTIGGMTTTDERGHTTTGQTRTRDKSKVTGSMEGGGTTTGCTREMETAAAGGGTQTDKSAIEEAMARSALAQISDMAEFEKQFAVKDDNDVSKSKLTTDGS